MSEEVGGGAAAATTHPTITVERRWAFAGLAATGLVLLALVIALVVGDDDASGEPGFHGPYGAVQSEGGPEGMPAPPPGYEGGAPDGVPPMGAPEGSVPPDMPGPDGYGEMPHAPEGYGYAPQAPGAPGGSDGQAPQNGGSGGGGSGN